MHFSCAYVRSCVCVCMWVWVCLRVRVYVCVCMWWLPSISLLLLLSSPLFFLSFPSLSRLPPPPPLCVCVYIYVLFSPSLFPPSLKAALHHTPPLHSPSCFDLCYQGISCVRLMGFFSEYSGFPIHPPGCLELEFCSSFSKVGLYLGRIAYFSCIIFNSVFFLSFPSPPPLFFVVLFFMHSNYCVILFTSRPSPFLV